MYQQSILISTEGFVLNLYEQWAKSRVCDVVPLTSFADFQCRNIGMIAVTKQRYGPVISLRPSIVSGAAVAALFYELADMDPAKRFGLRLYEGEWNHAIHPSRVSLMQAISRAHESALAPLVYLKKSVTLDAAPQGTALQRALSDWRAGVLDLTDKQVGQRLDTYGRYLVFREHESSEICFAGLGRKYQVLGGLDPKLVRGQPLTSVATNNAYLSEVQASYRETIARHQPQLDQIDALAEFGDEGLKRITYWRLVIPQRTHAGTILLSLSLDDDAIDLRRKVG